MYSAVDLPEDPLAALYAQMDDAEMELDDMAEDMYAGGAESGILGVEEDGEGNEESLREAQEQLASTEKRIIEYLESSPAALEREVELKVKGCGISRITKINVKLTTTVNEFKTIVADLPGASCSAEDMQVQRGDKTLGNELDSFPLYKVGIVKPNTVLKLVGPGSESKPARPAMESAAMTPPVRAPAPAVIAPSKPAIRQPAALADSNQLLMQII